MQFTTTLCTAVLLSTTDPSATSTGASNFGKTNCQDAMPVTQPITEPANGENGPSGNDCKIALLEQELAIARHAKPKDIPEIPKGCTNG